MAKFNYDNLAANLPDAYAKDKDSNNAKLLKIESKIYDKILEIFMQVKDCTDIDKATNATLDMYGVRQQVKRGTSTDEQYRLRIKGKIAQSFCDGSRDSVAEALAYILSTDTSRIKIKSGDTTGIVKLLDMPFDTLRQADLTVDQFHSIIEELLPSGVQLSAQYSGTFRLGSAWGETSSEKGLGDIERTTGGTLGLITR
jgi:hypothetical protein